MRAASFCAHSERLLGRTQRRLRRRVGVVHRLPLDARQQRPGGDGLALLREHLEHGAANLGAHRGLALGLQLARDEGADRDRLALHLDHVLAPDLDLLPAPSAPAASGAAPLPQAESASALATTIEPVMNEAVRVTVVLPERR